MSTCCRSFSNGQSSRLSLETIALSVRALPLFPPLPVHGILMVVIHLPVLDLYPLAVSFFLIGLAVVAWGGALERWAQGIRDKEYLLETRVRNIEEVAAVEIAADEPQAF